MLASAAPATSQSPFLSILAWSKSWPAWQRDALRRIIVNGELQTQDFNELEELCRSAHGLGASSKTLPVANPLSDAHIPAGPDASSSVSLLRLSKLLNVNRIPNGSGMEFCPAPGLTVVFGDNGSGKSSYARVVKRACRARGTAPPIKPNVFDPNAKPPASAQIVCSVGAVETPFSWRDGAPADPRLSNIFVFDSASASLHVSADGPATFIPRGLDVLPKLAKACDEIRDRMKQKSDTATAKADQARANWPCKATTPTGAFVLAVSDVTDLKEIDARGAFGHAQAKRLTEISDALRSDARKKAQATLASAARVEAFADLIEMRAAAFSEEQLAAISNAIERSLAAADAAKAAAGPRFDGAYLPGTGGGPWRELWEIARTFSTTTAYPRSPFPVTHDGAQCVLCQQALDDAAKQRLRDFEGYVRSQSQLQADQARRVVSDLTQRYGALSKLKPEYTKIHTDVSGEPSETLEGIEEFCDAADAALDRVRSALGSLTWSGCPRLRPSPLEDLKHIIGKLNQRAEMERSADDPAQRATLQGEKDELESRQWLAKNREAVKTVVALCAHAARLKTCQADTTTNGITKKSGELHDTHVTKAFCERFKDEVKALGLATIQVKLESVRGTKGERRFGVRLDAPTAASIMDVASEGEQRCIALAAFLAELSQASHRSALVFDDPVSSLDHVHRMNVARRLCREATVRQVVVFTHDSIFFEELREFAGSENLRHECLYVSWSGASPGHCEKGLPHDWQKYTERIDALEKDAAHMNRSWSPQPSPANVEAMRAAYSRFRATVEKVVQDVVFNRVVVRFRAYIKLTPSDLRPVVGFSEGECDELLRLHKKACDITEAHDPAAGKHLQVPSPVEFRADVAALTALAKQISERRKAKAVLAKTAAKA